MLLRAMISKDETIHKPQLFIVIVFSRELYNIQAIHSSKQHLSPLSHIPADNNQMLQFQYKESIQTLLHKERYIPKAILSNILNITRNSN
jgi:hypothetical protein